MSAPILELRELKVHFTKNDTTIRAVDGVDLDVFPGETLALVGESGCGKSTLARTVLGLIRPSAGTLRFKGELLPPLVERPRSLCRQLQMVFQDPDASLNPRLTLGGSIGEPIALHESLDRGARAARVAELLEKVGLHAGMSSRYPHELSGGQRQRACIARALAVRPDVIVCDEAVSALDVSIQAQILNLLRDLQTEFGLTYLFITHDLGVVRQIAHRVAVMYLGELVELADTESLFRKPRHPYTRVLLAAVPSVDPGTPRRTHEARGDVPSPARPPSGCRFHTRCPEVFERCPRDKPDLYRTPAGLSRCFLVEDGRMLESRAKDGAQ